MIIVKLTGGLGNQLFQYAMGRNLALKHNTQLKLDLSFFENYEWHDYSLSPLNIIEHIASAGEVDGITRNNHSLIARINRKFFKPLKGQVFEKGLRFDPAYKNIKDQSYLDGYWQCEKYFADYESILRPEFQVKTPPSAANQALLDQIVQTDAISLHIRRGNYVNVASVNKVHGTCSMDYYEKAIELLASKCTAPVFYIFSDDVNWAKKNLKLNYDHHFVDINNDETDYEDLRLMYSCKHHIIANSTFSWWAAWLNPDKNKVVTAPEIWFADPNKNKEAADIIPSNWIKL